MSGDEEEEEEEIDVQYLPDPKKKGAMTAFIEKDTALRLYDRQQKQFLGIMASNHSVLRADMQANAKTNRKVLLGGLTAMTFFVVFSFAVLALIIGGKTSVETPDGSKIEIGPGN